MPGTTGSFAKRAKQKPSLPGQVVVCSLTTVNYGWKCKNGKAMYAAAGCDVKYKKWQSKQTSFRGGWWLPVAAMLHCECVESTRHKSAGEEPS